MSRLRLFLIVVLVTASSCRLFGAPDEEGPVRDDAGEEMGENNLNNLNNLNNVNNNVPDMSDMTTVEQPALPRPPVEEGRITEGRIFEFRFLEAAGTTATNLEGDIVMDLSATASWIDGRNGVLVDGNGMMLSRMPPAEFYDRIKTTEQFTIEAWVKPSTLSQGGPARFVAISADTSNAVMTLGQDWGGDWVARLRTTSSYANYGAPSLEAEGLADVDFETHIVFTYDGIRARLYVDGNLVVDEQRFGSFANWDTSYHMAFGNEQTPVRDWAGEIYLVAAYDHPFTIEDVRNHFVIGSQF